MITTAKPEVLATPVPAAPVAAPEPVLPVITTVRVECVDIDSMEQPVRIAEPGEKPGDKESYHTCMRRVHTYKFVPERTNVSHPQVELKLATLQSLPFEVGKFYKVSFT